MITGPVFRFAHDGRAWAVNPHDMNPGNLVIEVEVAAGFGQGRDIGRLRSMLDALVRELDELCQTASDLEADAKVVDLDGRRTSG